MDKNLETGILDILHQRNKEGESLEQVQYFLTTVYHLPEKEMRFLYHHSQKSAVKSINAISII